MVRDKGTEVFVHYHIHLVSLSPGTLVILSLSFDKNSGNNSIFPMPLLDKDLYKSQLMLQHNMFIQNRKAEH